MAQTAVTQGRREPLGYLGVLVACICWGFSGILIKLIMAGEAVSPLALAFWRDVFTFAILALGLGLWRPQWLRVERRDLIRLAGLGAIGIGTFNVFWNLGILFNGAAVATVQQAAMPIVVAVAARLLWREPLTGRKVASIVLAFTGTVLISGLDPVGNARPSARGLLIGLGIPVAYAAYNLLAKPLAGRYPSLTILTYGFGFGALALLPCQFFTAQPTSLPASTWLWFAGLIGLATILPYGAYTFGLGRLPAGVAGILAMSEILFVCLFAYLLLGERLTLVQCAGAALVIAGVLLLFLGRGSPRAS